MAGCWDGCDDGWRCCKGFDRCDCDRGNGDCSRDGGGDDGGKKTYAGLACVSACYSVAAAVVAFGARCGGGSDD